MSIAALFTIVKIWKKPKCPLTDEWIKIIYIYYIYMIYNIYILYIHTHTHIHIYTQGNNAQP